MWSEFVKIADILNKKDAKNKKKCEAIYEKIAKVISVLEKE